MDLLSQVAYLDAGTGSLIIQAIIGVLAGIGVFGRRIITSVKLKFAGGFKGGEAKTTTGKKTSND